MKTHILKSNLKDEYFFEEGCFILELSNSESDPQLSIARARLEPKKKTDLHCLSNTIERYVILEGQGEVSLGDTDPQTVAYGDVVIIPENCPQSIRNSGEQDLVFLVICTPRFKVENYIGLEKP